MDINEYNKYKTDKIKFGDKVFTVFDPRSGTYVKAKLYDHQKQILKNTDYMLIKKSRQVGISDGMKLDIVWNLNYIKDCNMLVVCPTTQHALDFKRKVVEQFNDMPDNIRVNDNKSPMKFSFGTDIGACVEFRVADPKLGRAQSYDVIYMDEVDHMNDFDNTYTNLCQTVSHRNSLGRMVITATPTNKNTTFSNLWANKNKFNKLEVTANTFSYNKIDENSLNSLTQEQYNKIIKECVIF